jgi:peroxiredoxin
MSHTKRYLLAALAALTLFVPALGRAAAEVEPAEAIVLSMDVDFQPVAWVGSDANASIFGVEHDDGMARMIVGEANKSKAFRYYFDVPIDGERYPLLVVRYRAVDLPSSNRVILWMDDGTGPNSGGASIFRQHQLVTDGEIHELRADLRELTFKDHAGPSGPIKELCFYFDSGDVTPAVFEVHDVRFVAAQPGPASERAAPLTITVVNTAGEPVAGATVTSDDERANFAQSAVTDALGQATVTPFGNDAAAHAISVEAEGYTPMRQTDIAAGASIEITLPRSAVLSGLVRNEDGEPIEGAMVDGLVTSSQSSRRIKYRRNFTVQTNADGRWHSPMVPIDLGRVVLKLSHPDYISDPYYGLTANASHEQLIAGDSVAVMKRGVTVTGVVVNEAGDPVAEAAVRQGRDRWGTSHPSVKTDAAGRFTFAQANPGEMILTVQAANLAPDVRRVTVTQDMAPLRFELATAHTVRGRVVDAAGEPIKGVHVVADTWRGYRTLLWSTSTDDEGRFVWDGAPADEVEFHILKKGYMSVRDCVLLPSDKERVVTLPYPLQITGRVVDAKTGEPIEQFNVIPGILFEGQPAPHWQRRSPTPGTNGTYEMTLTEQRPGRLVRIEAEGYMPAVSRAIQPDESAATIDFALERGESLAGVVRNAAGQPVAGAQVVLATPGQTAYIRNGREFHDQGCPKLITAADGRYDFPPQADPFALVVLHDDGYARVEQADLAESKDIVLQPWARVQGTLMIGAEPGANARMTVWMNDHHEPNQPRVYHDLKANTDEQGRFLFDRVPPGEGGVAHEVRIGDRQSAYTHSQSFDAQPGDTVSVQIGGTGRPVVGHIVKPDGVQVDIDYAYSHNSISTKIDMPRPPEWLMEMQGDIEQRRERYEQWIKSDEGKAYQTAIENAGRDRKNYTVVVEPDGHFRVEDIPAGTYTLSIQVMEPPQGNQCGFGQPIAMLHHEFEIPPMQSGRSDEPLNIGTHGLTAISRIRTGDDAPDFTCDTLDGKTITLSDMRGKYVLLDFWATWCGPCVAETPNLKAVYEQFGDDDRFVMIGLSVDPEADAPRKYAAKQKLGWIQGYLGEWSNTDVPKRYGVMGIPSILLIGPDGKVIATNLRGEQIREQVKRALQRSDAASL